MMQLVHLALAIDLPPARLAVGSPPILNPSERIELGCLVRKQRSPSKIVARHLGDKRAES